MAILAQPQHWLLSWVLDVGMHKSSLHLGGVEPFCPFMGHVTFVGASQALAPLTDNGQLLCKSVVPDWCHGNGRCVCFHEKALFVWNG